MKLLIVEDDVIYNKLYAKLFEEYEIVFKCTVGAAIVYLESNSDIDLILLDVQLRSKYNGLLLLPFTEDVKINWVWMPPWGPEKITDDGREQMRAIGFSI